MTEPLTVADFEKAKNLLKAKPGFSQPTDYIEAPRYVGQRALSYHGVPYTAVRIGGMLTWEIDAAS
jgi:hypothetical protein